MTPLVRWLSAASVLIPILLVPVRVAPAQEHLNTILTIELEEFAPGPAQQGIDFFDDSFYTSSGYYFGVNNKLYEYDVAWNELQDAGPFLFLPPHFGDLSASNEFIYLPMSFYSNGLFDPAPFLLGVFDRATLDHEVNYDLGLLHEIYAFEDVAGVDYFDADIFMIDFRRDTPDNTRIFRIDLDQFQVIEVYEIETREGNGIELLGTYIYITSNRDAELGELHVYDYDQLSQAALNSPLTTYTYDVSGDPFKFSEHAEGLSFRGTDLWVAVANGTKVRWIETPILPCDDILEVPAEYSTIQAAIDAACEGSEVVVAPGTYPETINFLGKAITVRSSDGPDATIIDAQGTGTVVSCGSGEGPHAVLDGFTITGGAANSGGGMSNYNSSPTVTNCRFYGNTAGYSGAGMKNYNSDPTIMDCMFEANSASVVGGGMYNFISSPTLNNCTFSTNTAGFGGGILNSYSTPIMTNCTFSYNSATTFSGGGMRNSGGGTNPVVTGCTFTGNNAATSGGGVANYFGAYPIVTNCTFSTNTASIDGGGMYSDGNSSPTVGDSIFCENTPDHIFGDWTDDGGNEFCPLCDGDVNGDGSVGVSDLLSLLASWGPCKGCPADFDGNGAVGVSDLLALLANWGPCP